MPFHYIAPLGALLSVAALILAQVAFRRPRTPVSPDEVVIRGAAARRASPKDFFANNAELLVKIALTFVVLAFSMFLIVRFNEDKEIRSWAFGMIGLIVGNWINFKDAGASNRRRR